MCIDKAGFVPVIKDVLAKVGFGPVFSDVVVGFAGAVISDVTVRSKARFAGPVISDVLGWICWCYNQ
jgi:hypothetical protein